MQFSVIVEGPMESYACSDDALLELERFLRASDIPPHLLQQLKKGQPQVLKNELSYEQAVNISDRLSDLGLDSVIDPPIKPDDDDNETISAEEIPPVKTLKSQATPANRVKKTHSQHPQQANIANRKPNLAVVKAAANKTAKPAQLKMATVAAKSPSHQNLNAGRKIAPTAVTGKNQIAGPATAKQAPTTAKTAKPSSGTTASAKKPQPNDSLSKAAADIKSLFNLPKTGALELQPPLATRFKLNLAAVIGVAVPCLYIAIWCSIIYLSIVASLGLYSALGFLVAPLPLVIAVSLFALTHLPYYLARNNRPPEIVLKAKEEPRLFMLVSAIAKVLNAPAPTSIVLTDSSRLNATQLSTVKDFFNLKESLPGDVQLSIGAVLPQCLSIRDFCSLAAKEMGIFANPKLLRAYWLLQYALQGSRFFSQPHPELQKKLRELNENTSITFVQKLLGFTAAVSEKCHGIACAYFERSNALLKYFARGGNKLRLKYQQAFLGGVAIDDVIDNLVLVDASYASAIEEMLHNNTKARYVNNLPEFCEYLLQKNRSTQSEASTAKPRQQSGTGIVTSKAPMRNIINQLEPLCTALTRMSYEHAGLSLDGIELCSLRSLFQHEVKDQKFNHAATEYFLDWLHPLQFWRLPSDASLPTNNTEATITRLNNSIARIRYIAPDRQNWLHRYDKLLKQFSELKAAKKVVVSGNSFDYQRCADSARTLDADLAQRTIQVKEAQVELKQHNSVMGERIALGLKLNTQQKDLSAKLSQALIACQSVAEKAITLVLAIEELNHILRHKPKNQAQQFQLYVRELTETISEGEKSIRKRLTQCPFDMIDRRYPTMAQFISSQQSPHDSLAMSHEQLIVSKARDTVAAVNWAYKQINQRAAYVAAAAEKQFGVERIKKVEGAH